jgi:asparagine synthase (glutamine-hydrolysing)
MCSISGVIQKAIDSRKPAAATAVERMNAALRHRGPDDSGSAELKSESGETVGYFGNTRLAIIDTSPAGHMPMHDPDTGNWITYNGETYNFQQLRREIGDEFGPWRSNTDTEVVLRAYRKWGIEAFGRLRGMFALAIWDNIKQELVIARDRFGIKPLYYYLDSNAEAPSLVFASEIRALLASEQVPRKLSSSAVTSFLQFGSVQAPLTIIEHVRSLMPGQCLTVSANSSSSFNIELLPFAMPADNPLPKSRPEAKAQLRTILEDSVQQHLVSDVPIGVFLSGGMDSSAIVALMSRVSSEQPKTFSVVFSEQQFSEASHSRLVAEKFKTDHCEVELGETALLDSLPQAIAALDQPSMDGINTYVVSKAVKEAGVTVALSGLGGDELFGGYPSFRRALTVQSTNRLAKRLLKVVSPIGQRAQKGSAQRDKFWQLASGDGSAASVYSISRQLFSDETVKSLSAAGDNGVGVATSSNGHADTFKRDLKARVGRLHGEYVVTGH